MCNFFNFIYLFALTAIIYSIYYVWKCILYIFAGDFYKQKIKSLWKGFMTLKMFFSYQTLVTYLYVFIITLKIVRNIAKSAKFKSVWKARKSKSVKLKFSKTKFFYSK